VDTEQANRLEKGSGPMTMTKKRRSPQHIQHPIELLRSPAMRVLSRAGHKILMCIESELCRHGGKDNGQLPVTYEAFVEFGIERHLAAKALREVDALGLSRITKRGRAGNAEHRSPNLHLLTYLPTNDQPATNEWKAIETMDEAREIAKKARQNKPAKRHRRRPIFSGGFSQSPVRKTTTENSDFQCVKPPLENPNSQCAKPPLLSRYLASDLASAAESEGSEAGSAGPESLDDIELRNARTEAEKLQPADLHNERVAATSDAAEQSSVAAKPVHPPKRRWTIAQLVAEYGDDALAIAASIADGCFDGVLVDE
jgi:hypothetical protein